MANLSSNINTRRFTLNLPIELFKRINAYRLNVGFNYSAAIISLLYKSLEFYENKNNIYN